jgi:hypothetical protein
MLEAIIAGEEDPENLADLARRRLRAKIPALKLALRGRVTDHHRFLLRLLLGCVAHLEDLRGHLGGRSRRSWPLWRKRQPACTASRA